MGMWGLGIWSCLSWSSASSGTVHVAFHFLVMSQGRAVAFSQILCAY